MTHTNTIEKAPGACDSKGLTTDTNSADFPTTDADSKAFTALAVGFAHAGHTLHSTDPKNGAVTYWAARWGMVRFLPTIDAARRFLDQVGGRL
jgi:hypothetical protein